MPNLPPQRFIPEHVGTLWNKFLVENTSGSEIGADKVVVVSSTDTAGVHLKGAAALADGTDTDKRFMLVSLHKIPTTQFGATAELAVVSLDTSSGAVGDPVYLSESVAGDITLSAGSHSRQVGYVLVAASAGLVLLAPNFYAQATSSATAYWVATQDVAGGDTVALTASNLYSVDNSSAGGGTMTLPLANSVTEGTAIGIRPKSNNPSNTFTIATSGADTLDEFTHGATLIGGIFVSDGSAQWIVYAEYIAIVV